MKLGLASIFALTFVSLGCYGQSEGPASTQECSQQTIHGYDISWCHESVPGSQSKDVILWFHGIDGSQESWHEDQRRNEMYFKTSPHVISFSFGPRWFLTDVGVFVDSRLDVFVKEVMPLVPKILGFEPERKFLMGESMGGFNALRLASEAPKEFTKMIAFCPAVMEYSPFWLPWTREEYFEKHRYMDRALITKLILFAYWEFHTPWEWSRNNPIDRAESTSYFLPAIFISDNEQDQYGFNGGTESLFKLLQAHSLSAQLFSESGRHCVHTEQMYKAASDFLGL
jgi:pimeloyl-ACP methyl ester carboxylesterase